MDALVAEDIPAETADVAIATSGQAGVLREDLRRMLPGEGLPETHDRREATENLGIGQGFTGGGGGCSQQSHAAFAVGHRPGLLQPGGGRQDDMSEGGGGSRIAILRDHELCSRQGGIDELGIGQRLDRIRGQDPHRLDGAGREGFEEFDGGQTGFFRYCSDAPSARDLCAIGRIGEIAMIAGESGHAADLAPTHRIGLTGQAEGSAAGLAELAGDQRQGDQGGVLVDPDRGLVEPHGPHGEKTTFARQPGGGLGDVLGRQSTDRGGGFQSPGRAGGGPGRIPVDVGGDVCVVDRTQADQLAAESIVQLHIGAWDQLQMEIGEFGAGGASGIHDHDPDVGISLLAGFDPAPDDGMGPGGIAAGDQKRVAGFDIFVTGWRPILTQGLLIPGHC